MVNFLIQGQSQRGQILEPESTKVFATGEVHAMQEIDPSLFQTVKTNAALKEALVVKHSFTWLLQF